MIYNGNIVKFGVEIRNGAEYIITNYTDTYLLIYLPFEELLASLQAILHEAIEKREQHLASINERSQKLDEIMAILKR